MEAENPGMNTSLQPRHLGLAFLVVVVWGLNFAVIKVGVADMPPLLLGALRYLLAAFPALLFVRPPRLPLRLYFLYGMTMAVGQFALLFTAIHLGMPSGLASLVLQAQSFFTLLLAAWWLREPWHANQIAGLALAAMGLVLIGSAHGGAMPLVGFALTVGAAAMWGCGNIVTRAVGRHGPMNQFAFIVWSSLVAPLPFLALSLWLDGPTTVVTALRHLSVQSMAAVAYIAWISTLLGFGLWTFLMSRYPVNRVAPFTLLVPLVGLTTGWVAFGEALEPVHFVGAGLLMAGLLVNLLGGRAWAALKRRLRAAS